MLSAVMQIKAHYRLVRRINAPYVAAIADQPFSIACNSTKPFPPRHSNSYAPTFASVQECEQPTAEKFQFHSGSYHPFSANGKENPDKHKEYFHSSEYWHKQNQYEEWQAESAHAIHSSLQNLPELSQALSERCTDDLKLPYLPSVS